MYLKQIVWLIDWIHMVWCFREAMAAVVVASETYSCPTCHIRDFLQVYHENIKLKVLLLIFG